MRNYINEMIKRKDLLIHLVMSGLKAEHRNSYLGYFWWLLDPFIKRWSLLFFNGCCVRERGRRLPSFF